MCLFQFYYLFRFLWFIPFVYLRLEFQFTLTINKKKKKRLRNVKKNRKEKISSTLPDFPLFIIKTHNTSLPSAACNYRVMNLNQFSFVTKLFRRVLNMQVRKKMKECDLTAVIRCKLVNFIRVRFI